MDGVVAERGGRDSRREIGCVWGGNDGEDRTDAKDEDGGDACCEGGAGDEKIGGVERGWMN